jgi:adenylate cyclase
VRERVVTPPAGATPTALRAPDALREDTARRPALPERKLELLLDISKSLARAVELDPLLDRIARLLVQAMDVDRVALLLADGDREEGELTPRISRDRSGADVPRPVPRSIARRVLADRVAVLTHNAISDERFGGDSIVAQQVRSALCAPLVASDGSALGVLYVDNRTATGVLSEEDLEFLVAFSGIAAVAIENNRLAARVRRQALVRTNFERYFTPALAAQIAGATEAPAPGGEKRRVVILFSDIRGFMPLAERMAPADVAALLSEYFTAMVDCVFRHGGTLDKFVGDALLAQWGAPVASDDDADRALQAALDMRHALATLNAEWRARGRPELAVGIGLNMGDVFAGNIGSPQRLEFTIIGDAVNVASRVCAAAAGGEILLTEHVRRALHADVPLEERPPLAIRGTSQATSIWRVRA